MAKMRYQRGRGRKGGREVACRNLLTILMCSMSVHYIIQRTLITNKCTKRVFVNCNTFLHVSTLLGHLQGELFCYRYTKVALYSWVRMCCCLYTGGVNCLAVRTAEISRLQKQRSTQSTAHSHSTVKCNLSVRATKKFSLKMTQQGRNM
jgi:hypothetical protein